MDLTGPLAWLMWLAVHLAFLTGFRNRVTAVLHWTVSFLGNGRPERTATERAVFARTALTLVPGGAAGLARPIPPGSVLVTTSKEQCMNIKAAMVAGPGTGRPLRAHRHSDQQCRGSLALARACDERRP